MGRVVRVTMKRILLLIRDISIFSSVRNGFFNTLGVESVASAIIQPANILKLFFVKKLTSW
jgi:hypothetical protein